MVRPGSLLYGEDYTLDPLNVLTPVLITFKTKVAII